MTHRVGRVALGLHAAVTLLVGAALFGVPRAAAAYWPWPLPPLAARFMGALFLGGAICSIVCLRASGGRAVRVLAWLAVGDLLIALAGVLGPAEAGMAVELARFAGFFAALAALLFVAAAGTRAEAAWPLPAPLLRALRVFFALHLVVVLPVGGAMYFTPEWAQPLWPWKMTPINVRLIGSFFLGAAFISAWALRQRAAPTLRAILALYVTFTSLATLAALLHLGLFDPTRRTTWAFFALYVGVAAGSAWLLHALARATRAAPS